MGPKRASVLVEPLEISRLPRTSETVCVHLGSPVRERRLAAFARLGAGELADGLGGRHDAADPIRSLARV
jgi:hypothetical protein